MAPLEHGRWIGASLDLGRRDEEPPAKSTCRIVDSERPCVCRPASTASLLWTRRRRGLGDWQERQGESSPSTRVMAWPDCGTVSTWARQVGSILRTRPDDASCLARGFCTTEEGRHRCRRVPAAMPLALLSRAAPAALTFAVVRASSMYASSRRVPACRLNKHAFALERAAVVRRPAPKRRSP